MKRSPLVGFDYGFFLAAVGSCLLLMSVSPALAEPTATALARQMRETLELLQSARTERLNAEAQFRRQEQQLETQIEKLKKEQHRQQTALARQQAENRNLQDRLSALQQEDQLERDHLTQRANTLKPFVSRMHARVSDGIDWRRDKRVARLDSIAEGLDGADVSVMVQAITDYYAFVSEEFRATRTIELDNQTVPWAKNQRTHAYIVRVGLLGQAAISEDQRYLAIDIKSTAPAWQRVSDAETRHQLLQAVDVLRLKRKPEIGPFPIWDRPAQVFAGEAP